MCFLKKVLVEVKFPENKEMSLKVEGVVCRSLLACITVYDLFEKRLSIAAITPICPQISKTRLTQLG